MLSAALLRCSWMLRVSGRRAFSCPSSWRYAQSSDGLFSNLNSRQTSAHLLRAKHLAHDRAMLQAPLSVRTLSGGPVRQPTDDRLSFMDRWRTVMDWKHWVVHTRYGRLMRLDKPTGTNLLFLPAAWSITLGAGSVVDALHLYALFYGGAILLRGAGCTINDIWDADIDPHVNRTKARPIAAGEVSIPAAFVFLGAQLSAGLAVLLSLNQTSFVVGAPVVIPVMLYPLAKRTTAYPQAVLGLTFNWGALLGYAAAADTLSASALCLYGAGWCWTLIYDTIYAHQDKNDDARLGVLSSALTLGDNVRPVLSGLAFAKISCLALAGVLGDLANPYYAGVAIAGAHSLKQIWWTDLDDSKQCLAAFNRSSLTGAITWAAIAAGRIC